MEIFLYYSRNITLYSNLINNQNFQSLYTTLPGIIIERSLNNTVDYNRVFEVTSGIRLHYANYTIVKNNIFSHWTLKCIEQWDCDIITNQFINNTCIDLGYEKIYNPENSKKEDNWILVFTLILTIGITGVISGYSIYYVKVNRIKKKRTKEIYPKKKFSALTYEKNVIEKATNKENVLKAFSKESFLNPDSLYNNLDLTIISKDHLKIIEKFGFDEELKYQFIREMLSYSIDERDDFLKKMIKDLSLE